MLIRLRFPLLIIFFLVVYTSTRAQDAMLTEHPSEYELELLDLNFKYSKDMFSDFAEDSKGNIWISSSTGLHVFDGYQTISYNRESGFLHIDNDSIDNYIMSIVIDRDDNIYARSYQSFFRFDADKRSCDFSYWFDHVTPLLFMNLEATDSTAVVFLKVDTMNYMNVLKIDESDQLTNLGKYKLGRYYDYSSYCISFSDNESHYIQLENDVFEFDYKANAFRKINTEGNLYYYEEEYPEKSYYESSNILYEHNIAEHRIEKLFEIPPKLESNLIKMAVGDDGLIYSGYTVIDPDKKAFYDLTSSLYEEINSKSSGSIADDIVAIKKMKDGRMFLLTSKNLFRIKKKIPSNTQFRESIEGFDLQPSVRGLAEDDDGNIYITYYNAGLAVKKKGSSTFVPIRIKSDLTKLMRSVFHLDYWKGHLLWNNLKVNLSDYSVVPLIEDIEGEHIVQCLIGDSLWQYKWYSNDIQISDLTNNETSSYVLDDDIVSPSFFDITNALLPNSDSTSFYFAHAFIGISSITDKGQLVERNYTIDPTDKFSSTIHDLLVDDDILWLAEIRGLGKIDTETGSMSVKPSNYIDDNNKVQTRIFYVLMEDERDNFYIGSKYGLLYYNKAEDEIYTLPKGHPLSTLEFNRASKFRDSTGRYYFGTTNGLVSFVPSELSFENMSTDLSELRLVSVSYFDQLKENQVSISSDLDSISTLHLKPKYANLSLLFSCPDLENELFYSYRIAGATDTWSDLDVNPEINFNYLPPGTHILQVKTTSKSSNDIGVIKELTIIVDQLWYKKWYIIPLLVLLITGLIALYFRYIYNQKLKQQEKINQLRNNISNDLHDDVGSILTGMAMQSEVIAIGKKGEEQQSLMDIATMSREATERMRDIVWAMDSSKDKFQNLIDRMQDVALSTLAPLSIKFNFEIGTIDLSEFIAPNKRKEIHLIFKEALTNITKHSNASFVKISFHRIKDKIELVIADNGTVIQLQKSDGVGLGNMKRRARTIGGILSYENVDGFVVRLSFDVE